tara:strand:+ start:13943 stop:14335 length:393 start_codon:yes stop_codon:yes gene_type:complete
MLDLGIEELQKKIIKEEKLIEKIYGPDGKHHDVITAVLLLCLFLKMYFQGDLKGILHELKLNSIPLRNSTLLVAVIFTIFKENRTITLSILHALFAVFFHILTHSKNIVNLFWFTLISAYYFNAPEGGEH